MTSNKLAPIIIFTYNRTTDIKQTISALKENFLSKDSDLYIFSDYANKNEDIEAVKEVREFLHSIEGFKSIKIIERESNYGLAKNIIEGVTEIINIHGNFRKKMYSSLYLENREKIYLKGVGIFKR